jgi:type IV pilus assembly protein PilA
MNKNKNRGFTIIELMAVVSIVSILAVIALAVYGDFVVRSKVSEGLSFAAEAKTAVSSYYYMEKRMPADNDAAGLAAKTDYDKPEGYIRSLEITTQPKPGTITITFKIPGTKADNKELQLVPSTMKEIVFWTCIPPDDNGIDVTQVPPNCRG